MISGVASSMFLRAFSFGESVLCVSPCPSVPSSSIPSPFFFGFSNSIFSTFSLSFSSPFSIEFSLSCSSTFYEESVLSSEIFSLLSSDNFSISSFSEAFSFSSFSEAF
jgi:hypothetical protein